jgi:hypothetical protein
MSVLLLCVKSFLQILFTKIELFIYKSNVECGIYVEEYTSSVLLNTNIFIE